MEIKLQAIRFEPTEKLQDFVQKNTRVAKWGRL